MQIKDKSSLNYFRNSIGDLDDAQEKFYSERDKSFVEENEKAKDTELEAENDTTGDSDDDSGKEKPAWKIKRKD